MVSAPTPSATLDPVVGNLGIHPRCSQVSLDPRNKEVKLDSLMYGTMGGLTEQELKKNKQNTSTLPLQWW